MAGAKQIIDGKLDSREVVSALEALLAATGDLQPAFREMGEHLLISHRERFAAEESPEGVAWEPLDTDYQRRKKKNADKILVLDGYLSGTLAYNVDSEGMEFGTNRIYGATHYFGAPERGIPARPWLGLSSDDQASILDILENHLRRA